METAQHCDRFLTGNVMPYADCTQEPETAHILRHDTTELSRFVRSLIPQTGQSPDREIVDLRSSISRRLNSVQAEERSGRAMLKPTGFFVPDRHT